MYWARSRVLEYLSSQNAPAAGCHAHARAGRHRRRLGLRVCAGRSLGKADLAELRSLQDFNLRYALESVPGVAQVASVGGFEKQFQVNLSPDKLRAYGVSVSDVADAVRRANSEVGGRVLEMAGREYYVRGRGYLKNLEELESVAIRAGPNAAPIRVADVGRVEIGPDIRRGLAELAAVAKPSGDRDRPLRRKRPGLIARVEDKLDSLRGSYRQGSSRHPYDRSGLTIARSLRWTRSPKR